MLARSAWIAAKEGREAIVERRIGTIVLGRVEIPVSAAVT